MSEESWNFEVVVGSDPNASPIHLLLTPGRASFFDPTDHKLDSIPLTPEQTIIDYHKATGHIRIYQNGTSPENAKVFWPKIREEQESPSLADSSSPSLSTLPLPTIAVLTAIQKSYITPKAPQNLPSERTQPHPALSEDYAALPPLRKANEKLPQSPLKFAESTTSPTWLVARVVSFMPATPSECFVIAWNSPLSGVQIRKRLYPAFSALSTAMQAKNARLPTVPSNWRTDKAKLQRELDAWLLDIVRLDSRQEVLWSFLEAPDDTCVVDLNATIPAYLSFSRVYAMWDAKDYVPQTTLFPPTSAKALTLLSGVSGSNKSSFINHIIGFPVCEPVGAAKDRPMHATFVEVVSPTQFISLAKLAPGDACWVHPRQENISAYPPETRMLVVGNELQEPITGRKDLSAKHGKAFITLDHFATLERYSIPPTSKLSVSSCIINEAVLDPIRLEYLVSRSNIFVELNGLDNLAHPSLEALSAPASPFSGNSTNMATTTSDFLPVLLDLATLRVTTHRSIYFAAFENMPQAKLDCSLLEMLELVAFNRSTYQSKDTLANWVNQALHENQLDVEKLLSLMKPWTHLLPTPLRTNSVLFLSPAALPAESQDMISGMIQIHPVLLTTGYVMVTQELHVSTLENSRLLSSVSVSVLGKPLDQSISSSTVQASSDFVLSSPIRDSFFLTLTRPPEASP